VRGATSALKAVTARARGCTRTKEIYGEGSLYTRQTTRCSRGMAAFDLQISVSVTAVNYTEVIRGGARTQSDRKPPSFFLPKRSAAAAQRRRPQRRPPRLLPCLAAAKAEAARLAAEEAERAAAAARAKLVEAKAKVAAVLTRQS